MSARRLVVVSAGLRQPSSTRLLADQLAKAAEHALRQAGEEVEVEVVELRTLAHDLTDHLLAGFPSSRLKEALEATQTADGLIAVTPIFSASYNGLFKNFFDVLEPDALAGKPVLIGATAGTPRHSLALEHAIRPLFTYLKALVVPTAVFAASEDWGGADGVDDALAERIERAAGQFAGLVLAYENAGHVEDQVTPFEDLLNP
ncbi:MAG TPA: FMN reductase [Acidimicrobiia bacterium]|jgi:FMN reductase|nr:FMN reductase [Acidimicrobiia bacterium]